jgi:hypothetical protein
LRLSYGLTCPALLLEYVAKNIYTLMSKLKIERRVGIG